MKVLNDLKSTHLIDIVPTFMGAHAIPIEYKKNPDEYVDYLCKVVIPEIILKHEKIQVVNAPKLGFASENIRKILSDGGSVKSLMPIASWTYLNSKNFYKKTINKQL